MAFKHGDQVRVATGTTIQTFGGGLRTPIALAQIPTGDPAVAWQEESHGSVVDDLHLAIAGGTAPAKPAPKLTVGAPVRRRLAPGESLTLHVRCNAACDLRATTATGGDGTLSLRTAGAGEIDITSQTRTLAPAHTSRIEVTFRYGRSRHGAPEDQDRRRQAHRRPAPAHAAHPAAEGDAQRRRRDGHVAGRPPDLLRGLLRERRRHGPSTPLVSADGGRMTNARRSFSVRLRGAAGVEVVVVHMRDDATGRTRRAATGVVP